MNALKEEIMNGKFKGPAGCGRKFRVAVWWIMPAVCMESAGQSGSGSSFGGNRPAKPILPEGTLRYEPAGTVDIRLKDGSSLKGIAGSVRFCRSDGDFMLSYVEPGENGKLPAGYLKTVTFEPIREGDSEYVHADISGTEGDTYSAAYSKHRTPAFIQADERSRIKEKVNDKDFIYRYRIRIMHFDREQQPPAALEYVLIEYGSDKPALPVPRDALLFETGYVTDTALYVNNPPPYLRFDGNSGLPLNKTSGYEILKSEKANGYDTRYEVKTVKKNGGSDRACVTGMLSVPALLNTGVTKTGPGHIRRITFAGNAADWETGRDSDLKQFTVSRIGPFRVFSFSKQDFSGKEF